MNAIPLRQSTQRVVRIGPVVAVGDGFTPVTTLALGTADEAELLKAAGAATVDISGATFAAVTGADGYYDLTLTTSHTDTLGDLTVAINDDSLCLPVKAHFVVMEEAIFDALYGSGAEPPGDAIFTLRKYGTLLVTGTTVIQLPVKKAAGGLAGSGDWTPAAGDVQVSIDGGALANVTNLPTYNDGWELILTAAELTGKNIRVFVKDQGVKVIRDLMVTIETFGHASAMIIPDIAAANVAQVLAEGTIGATGNDATHLHLSGLAYADDAINNHFLVVLDVSTGLYYVASISDWANTGDLATVSTLPFTPEASVDKYWLLSRTASASGLTAADVWTHATRTLTALDEDSTTLDIDAAVRAAVGMAAANLDTQVGDLPTNAELSTALAAADDAVLAAIAALNDLSAADVQTVLDACGITTAGGVTRMAGVDLATGGAAPASPIGEAP